MADRIDTLTHRLSVLSEPMRLDILMIISSEGTCNASQILSHFDITQPTLSHHMSVLIENEIVTATKQGRFMRYSINTKAVNELKSVLDVLCSGKKAASSVKLPSKVKAETPVVTETLSDKTRKKKKKSDKKKKDKKKKK